MKTRTEVQALTTEAFQLFVKLVVSNKDINVKQ